MSSAAPSNRPSALAQSPLWADFLDHVESEISGRRETKGARVVSLPALSARLAGAHSCALIALERGASVGADVVSRLSTESVELLNGVATVCASIGSPEQDRHVALVRQLQRRLGAHEEAVLAGEVTYGVAIQHAEVPAMRVRQAISLLSRTATRSDAHALSLRVAAVDLASVLVRLAANAAASGSAAEAPQQPTLVVRGQLDGVVADLADRAQAAERPFHKGGDVVAHHLAAGLRPAISHHTPEVPRRASADDASAGNELRDDWVRLATNEYVAVAALDAQLGTPAYSERFESLTAAIVESAASVIYGARLLGRAGSFRHRAARRHQTVALTYALEAYVAGIRGDDSSLAQAQLITLTRLGRCTVAIMMIDLARAAVPPTNGSARR